MHVDSKLLTFLVMIEVAELTSHWHGFPCTILNEFQEF